MRPARVEFANVGCYVGQHSVDLGASLYAVLAAHTSNPDRSNWLGKSTFLWLFPYALFGEHPEPTDDEFITDGQTGSVVTLSFDDGATVTRSKERGKTTQLQFEVGGVKLSQKAAQEAVVRYVGLSREDFMATCFFEQKKFARLVTARSAERMEIVEAWLAEDLDPLQRLHDAAAADLQGKVRAQSKQQESIENAKRRLAGLAATYAAEGCDPLYAIEAVLAQALQRRETAKASLTGAQAVVAENAQNERRRATLNASLSAIVSKGLELRRRLEALPDFSLQAQADAEQAEAHCKEAADKTWAELTRARSTARGEFDGSCPVTRKPCPSADWVRGCGVTPTELRALEGKATAAKREHDVALARVKDTEAAKRTSELVEVKLESMRQQYAKEDEELDALGEADINDTHRARLVAAQSEMEQSIKEQLQVEQDLSAWHANTAEVETASLAVAELRGEIGVCVEAVQLLGKNGAQKQLASEALATVESGANDLLASAGISLTVAVRWQSEAQGLAKHCDQCGTAFPTGAKVKKCPCCGADRGPNLVSKLTIELSNRSGAAEDLAGIAVGLAASNWLRAKRTSKWGALFLDEPFGALDAHHKRALSVHVNSMLRSSTESAFVVAHDKGLLDSLPSRISIVASDKQPSISIMAE